LVVVFLAVPDDVFFAGDDAVFFVAVFAAAVFLAVPDDAFFAVPVDAFFAGAAGSSPREAFARSTLACSAESRSTTSLPQPVMSSAAAGAGSAPAS